MLSAFWYHLYDFKNVKNNHGGVFFSGTLLKATLLHGYSLRFLNCTNGNKSRKASHMEKLVGSQQNTTLPSTDSSAESRF